jgi:hypothetical protein
MSLKTDIQKLKALHKPKKILRFVFSEAEITNEPNVVWVLFEF